MKTYYVNGMTCNGCVRNVTKLVASISDVDSVSINLVTSKLVFTSNRDVSFEEVEASLAGTKFKLTTQPPSFVSVFRKWFKKFLPLVAVFTVIILWTLHRQIFSGWSLHHAMYDFMGSFFIIFGTFKVLNWKKFAESYQAYDPLAMRFPLYAYVYPAIEVFLGFVYQFHFGNELIWNIITVVIMSISGYGIITVLRRGEMVRCSCLGGYFNIPITWFTVFENALMIAMAIYMQLFFGHI